MNKQLMIAFAFAMAMPSLASAQCHIHNVIQCAGMGGVAVGRSGDCWCDIYEWVPRRVSNAADGDVGIVPIDGRGSDVVETVTREIGQFHRHAVMFHDDGRQTRHNTMYIADGEDGSDDDAGGDYVTLLTPFVGRVRFDGDELQNGLPGAITQSIDDTYNRERLANTGLILKPAMSMSFVNGFFTMTEPNRPAFEDAVNASLSTAAYYKLGDYTDQDSMGRPWSSSRNGDLRGSHCSGYVTEFFRDEGMSIPDVFYPESLREDVADVLFTEVRAECRAKTGFWQDLFLGISGHWRACTNVANQVVNCFSDLGCGDTSNNWRNNVGSGSAVSPDNLLPETFRYSGSQNYNWDGNTLSQGSGPLYHFGGTPVSHPGLSGTEPAASANVASPFQRVQALRYTGGYTVLTNSVRL